ncbi:MAG: DUF1552 domain-containing protein [Verrucomicrobiota bacterium]
MKNMSVHNRRNFLKTAGVGLALPLLESVAPAAGERSGPKRLVCIGVYLGFYLPDWLPTEAGADYRMSPVLTPLERHRRDFSVFSGLDHRAPNGHKNWRNFLTGSGTPRVSLDQLVAERVGEQTRFASLQITCGRAPAEGQMCYTREGVLLPMIGRPSVLYEKLFTSATNKERLKYTLESGRSALDLVREEARLLNRQLGKADQEKLAEYFASLRDVEKKMRKQRAGLELPSPRVNYPLPRFDPVAPDLSLECESIMYDLMALALETDSTRVLSFLAPGSGQVFTIEGERLSAGYHGLSHHGNDPDKIADFNRIGIEHVKRLGHFLDQLKRKTDGTGRPLLDSTAVLYGSGMGDANTHNNARLPILLAGGGFKHGRHHRIDKDGASPRLLGDLFLTLLQSFGVEQHRFMKASRNLNELLV